MSKSPARPRSFSAVLTPIEETPAATIDAEAPAPAAPTPAPAPKASQNVGVLILMADEERQRLKMLAVHERTSLQQLGIEAWNLLLLQRGLPPIPAASATANRPNGQKAAKPRAQS